jgi:hypothetical protein
VIKASIWIFYDTNFAQNITNSSLDKLFEFFKNLGRITTIHNILQIELITPKYAYYKIFWLNLLYEYSTMLILHKTWVGCIKNSCLNKLFEFFKNFGRITSHNFSPINTITSKYIYYNIVQLKLQYEYFTTLILHET